jgi:hypothetical protein
MLRYDRLRAHPAALLKLSFVFLTRLLSFVLLLKCVATFQLVIIGQSWILKYAWSLYREQYSSTNVPDPSEIVGYFLE